MRSPAFRYVPAWTRSHNSTCIYRIVQPVCSKPSPSRSCTTSPSGAHNQAISNSNLPGITRHTPMGTARWGEIQCSPGRTISPAAMWTTGERPIQTGFKRQLEAWLA